MSLDELRWSLEKLMIIERFINQVLEIKLKRWETLAQRKVSRLTIMRFSGQEAGIDKLE